MNRRGLRPLEPGENYTEARSFTEVVRAHPMASQIRPLCEFRDLTEELPNGKTRTFWGCCFAYRLHDELPERLAAAAPTETVDVGLERARVQVELVNQEAAIETPFRITDYLEITKIE